MESILSEILLEASKTLLEKIRKGKKLSVEEIMLLYLDLMYREIRDFKREVYELYSKIEGKISEIDKRLDETNKRIDNLNKTLTTRIDETNKRIDSLYSISSKTI